MKNLILSAMAFAVVASSASAQNLLISEYVEGSNFNKAIEIYNDTGAPIPYADITISLYSNGAASPNQTWTPTLAGSLAAGDVYAFSNVAANASILSKVDETEFNVCNFNGDDTLTVEVASVLNDCFGQIGFDPGTGWTGSTNTTVNVTLVRMNTIPDTNSGDAFDPDANWTQFGIDVDTDLGIATVPVELSSFELE